MRKRRFLLLIVSMLTGCGAGNGQDERRTQSNAGTASENESNAATTEDSTGTSDRAKSDSDGIQGKNLVFREEEREMAPYCREENIALTPYSALAAKKYGISMTEVSLAWLLEKVTSPVVGMTKGAAGGGAEFRGRLNCYEPPGFSQNACCQICGPVQIDFLNEVF